MAIFFTCILGLTLVAKVKDGRVPAIRRWR